MSRNLKNKIRDFLSYFLPGFAIFSIGFYFISISFNLVLDWLFFGEITFNDYFGFLFRASLIFGFGFAVWFAYDSRWKS